MSEKNANITEEILVKIHNVRFSRGNKLIFEGLDLSITKGKITAIMGPSGIGKTTLLRLIAGQVTPQVGSITFDDIEIPTLNRNELYQTRKRMGMLFQSGALFTDLSVFENVAFPIKEHLSLPPEILKTLVLMKLEAVGLRGAANLMPSQLSGGMARRVALARAIALEPELLMFDEPFVGQDPISMGVLVELISQLNKALGITCIIVSHDVPEVMSIADYAYIIADKNVIAEGKPSQLVINQEPRVRQFLDGIANGPVAFNYPSNSFIDDILSSINTR